jgi:hypothetical protein
MMTTRSSRISIVWRASGPSFDIDRFLKDCPNAILDAVWRRGDVIFGQIRKESGFNVTVVDEASRQEVADVLSAALRQWSDTIERARVAGAQSGIDVSLFLGEDDFTTGFLLSEQVVSQLAAAKLDVEVSVYPISDELGGG